MIDKYRICFVAPEAYSVFSDRSDGPIGGAEIQQMLIAKALVKSGHNVHVIVKDKFYTDQYEWHGIHVYPCKFRYLLESNLYFVPDLIRLIYRMKFIGADFYLLKTPPSILFVMGLHRKIFGGKLIKLMASDADCEKSGVGLISYLYPLGCKCLDYTVFQSKFQQKTVKILNLKGGVIKNIVHGKIRLSDTKKDIDVLWVGDFGKNKQVNLVIKLAAMLPDYTFHIISRNNCGAEIIFDSVNKLKNVDLKINVPYSDISDIYKRSKILLCTSIIEGFPNTFLQAWQYGIPVVSLNVNPDNVITNNNIGCVSGNFEQMVKDIRDLLSNDDLRATISRNSIEYLNSSHSENTVIAAFEKIFEKMLPKCSKDISNE